MDIAKAKELLHEDMAFMAVVDFVDTTVRELGLPSDARILDVGTGDGNMAVILALNGFHVTTGEPVDDDSEYSKKDWQGRAEQLGVESSITFKPFAAEKMPFADGQFDVVFLLGCLHHIAEQVRSDALKECWRVVSAHGIICVFEPNEQCLKAIRKMYPSHPDAVDPIPAAQDLGLSAQISESALFRAYILRRGSSESSAN